MGVLPLQFMAGQNAVSLGLKGDASFDITGLRDGASRIVDVVATGSEGRLVSFKAQVLLITPKEIKYFRHGGILQYMLRQLASRKAT